jgi:dienelactone hydrolase
VSAYPDFTQRDHTFDGVTRTAYRQGVGPAVIVMHEIPGLYPAVVELARRVVAAGFTVFMPSLIGTPGRAFGSLYLLQSMARACVAREFTTWATRKRSPIIDWLRALAREAHAECGGPGVGAVGMCLTGGFALAMMVDDPMLAPVLSQPSLPFALTAAHKRDLGVDDATLVRIKQRAADGVCVLGLRFTADFMVPPERFARLRDELGDAFIAVEIDSSPGNPHGLGRTAHSVLTRDLVDEPGHPTHAARERVLEFFRERLLPA